MAMSTAPGTALRHSERDMSISAPNDRCRRIHNGASGGSERDRAALNCRRLTAAGLVRYLTDQLFNRMVKLNLDATFSALADPTRRAILARLALGETAVMELAEPFAMSLPAVSKHLKVLERAGLITRGREAQWRPCRIEPRALKEVDDWLEHYRRFYDESFDRLDDYLKKLQAKDVPTKEPKGKNPKARSTKHGRRK
jgi:DNA-binding transcriptional ArsR family regulator